jgi:hypothetical protein
MICHFKERSDEEPAFSLQDATAVSPQPLPAMLTITDFEAGVQLPRARCPSGTSGLHSGKYIAAFPRGMS